MSGEPAGLFESYESPTKWRMYGAVAFAAMVVAWLLLWRMAGSTPGEAGALMLLAGVGLLVLGAVVAAAVHRLAFRRQGVVREEWTPPEVTAVRRMVFHRYQRRIVYPSSVLGVWLLIGGAFAMTWEAFRR